MKKIIAIAIALTMVFALAISVAADEVLFEYTTPFGMELGWTTLLEHGSEEALALYEALGTEGAVFKMTGVDLTEADMSEDGAWFQLCTQDQGGWTPAGDFKTEDVGESYEFTDGGYVLSVPAEAIYSALSASGLDSANFGYVLNAGNWSKATSVISVAVVAPDGAAAATAETETSAETSAPAETDAPAAAAESETSPDTGLAIAVIPAAIALAAIAVSKKR